MHIQDIVQEKIMNNIEEKKEEIKIREIIQEHQYNQSSHLHVDNQKPQKPKEGLQSIFGMNKDHEQSQQLNSNNSQNNLKANFEQVLDSAIFLVHGKTILYDKKSLFIFSQSNKFRHLCVWLVNWQVFEYIVIMTIISNSLVLAIYDYSDKDSFTFYNQVLDLFQIAFTVFFTIECVLKIIAMGFVLKKNSYLRDGWNIIDMTVVIFGFIDFLPVNANMKSLRILRVLRPLRSINAIKRMKNLVNTLIKALPSFANVAIFLLFIFILFGILGIQIYSDTFYYRCRTIPEPYFNQTTQRYAWPIAHQYYDRLCSMPDADGVFKCPTGTFCGNPGHYGISLDIDDVSNDFNIKYGITTFDHIGKALLTEFGILTNDDWASILFNVMDAEVPWIAALYFCFLVVFGSFFLVNIILAVILESFTKVQQEDLKKTLKNNEEKMAKIYLQIEKDKKELMIQHDQKRMNKIWKNEIDDDSLSKIKEQIQDQTALEVNIQEPKQKESSFEEESKFESSMEIQQLPDDSFQNLNDSSRNLLQEPNLDPAKLQSLFNEQPPRLNNKEISLNFVPVENKSIQDESQTQINRQKFQFKRLSKSKSNIKHVNEAIKDPEQTFEILPDFFLDCSLNKQNQQTVFQSPLIEQKSKKSPNILRSITRKINEFIDEEDLTESKQQQQVQKKSSQDIKIEQNLNNLQMALEKNKQENNFHQFIALKRALKKVENSNQNQSIETDNNQREKAMNHYKVIKFFYKIAHSKYFSYFISIFIIFNTIILALDKYPQSNYEDYILEKLNIMFFIVFLLELIIKLLGLGYKQYFRSLFNTFDCAIVFISAIDITLQNLLKNTSQSNIAILALRAFRLLRIFKLAKNWQKFQDLLKTIGNTLKDISTFSILLFLFIFTYTLLGLELFSYRCAKTPDDKIDLENGTPPLSNFNTLFNSFLSVFILLTGDGWSQIMFDYYRSVDSTLTIFYFISLLIIGQYILLNLFLAILLQNFEEDSIDQELYKKQIKEEKLKKQKKKLKIQRFFKKIQRQLLKIFKCKSKSKKEQYELTETQMKESEIIVDQEKSRKKAQIFLNKIINKGLTQAATNTTIKIKENFKLMQGKSLYVFSLTNPIRRIIYRVVNNNKFDYLILVFILVSCIQLALDNPLNDPQGQLVKVLYYIDIITTLVFMIELVLKIIAFGLIINGENSYLKNSSNILDFFVIILSVISLSNDSVNLNVFKIFRLLRVLRPLRVISRNDGLKIAVQALWMAVPKVINVLIISLLFFLIFGIIGVNYFKGEFYYCYTDHLDKAFFTPIITTKWDCLLTGGIWLNKYYNFDNVLNAMMTLFQIATLAGWTDVMYTAISTDGIDNQLIPMNKPYMCLYFVAFVIIGAFFTLNLFVGIVISTFNREKESLGKDFLLTQNQRQWLDAKMLIFRQKPKVVVRQHKSKFRNFCLLIQRHKYFDQFIFVCILLNTLVLMIKWNGQPQIVTSITDAFNFIFAGIFTLEAIIKIIGLGKVYFKDNWNVFDFIIVVTTLIAIILQQSTTISYGPQITVIRSVRIFRIFRLIRRAKSLKIMFNTFIYTLPSMGNVGGLLGLLIFLYAILGINLFAQIKIIEPMNDVQNFQSFSSSILILVKLATGDGWPDLLQAMIREQDLLNQCEQNPSYDDYVNNNMATVGCGQQETAILYIYSYLLIVKLVFLNLFIAIILQGFDDTNQQQHKTFNNDLLEHFREIWSHFDPDGTGYIKIFILPDLLYELGKPMGWDKEQGVEEEHKQKLIEELNLSIYNDFKDYSYIDVLSSLSLKVLIEENFKSHIKSMVQAKKAESNLQQIKDQMKQDLQALDENEENIQAVKSVIEKERKIKGQLSKANAIIFTYKHEKSARLLIKHLRRYVQRKRLQKGIQIQEYSEDQLREIENRLCEQLEQMAAADQQKNYDIENGPNIELRQIIQKRRTEQIKKQTIFNPQINRPENDDTSSKNEEIKVEENTFQECRESEILKAPEADQEFIKMISRKNLNFANEDLGIGHKTSRVLGINQNQLSVDSMANELLISNNCHKESKSNENNELLFENIGKNKSSGVPNYETGSNNSNSTPSGRQYIIGLNKDIKIQQRKTQSIMVAQNYILDEEIKIQEIS